MNPLDWGLFSEFWSLVPLLISDIHHLSYDPSLSDSHYFSIMGNSSLIPLQNVEITGIVVEIQQRKDFQFLTIDDGTGTVLSLPLNITSHSIGCIQINRKLPTTESRWIFGKLVRISGKIFRCAGQTQRMIRSTRLHIVKDPHEEIHHWVRRHRWEEAVSHPDYLPNRDIIKASIPPMVSSLCNCNQEFMPQFLVCVCELRALVPTLTPDLITSALTTLQLFEACANNTHNTDHEESNNCVLFLFSSFKTSDAMKVMSKII